MSRRGWCEERGARGLASASGGLQRGQWDQLGQFSEILGGGTDNFRIINPKDFRVVT